MNFVIELKEDNMKPLAVLLSSFVIAILCFTAIGHFAFTKGMSMMIPQFIPYKETFVQLTGIFEILLASGLLIPKLKVISAWTLIVFLLLMLPANIYASLNNVNYQKGTFDGNGLSYLWFRIPLQFLFIVWSYYSSIRFP